MKEKILLSTPLLSFGIPLWVLLLASTAAFIVAAACVILCICYIHHPHRKPYKTRFSLPKSMPSSRYRVLHSSSSLDKRLLSSSSINISELENNNFEELSDDHHIDELDLPDLPQVNNGFVMRHGYFGREFSFRLKELEYATNGFAQENEIGSGEDGSVYFGLLPDNRRVVVKRLVSDSCQNEEFFASQMEAIGRAKHRTLVKLLGYCTEGTHRILVFEFVGNGNLDQWLHDFPGEVSPLTWTKRLHILQSVAKGLAYLHEEAEPRILHGNINSRNILLDQQWNPKISGYGLSKLLSTEWSHSIMEELGYVSPDCHSTRIFTEGNDIYGFGIIIMEIISGRVPLNNCQSQVHIVDWFKSMIANGRKVADLVDPKMPEMPFAIDLKRIILVALRCVDLDVNPKLKMGHVVRMLETNLILSSEHHIAMEPCEQNLSPQTTPARLEETHYERNRRLSNSSLAKN